MDNNKKKLSQLNESDNKRDEEDFSEYLKKIHEDLMKNCFSPINTSENVITEDEYKKKAIIELGFKIELIRFIAIAIYLLGSIILAIGISFAIKSFSDITINNSIKDNNRYLYIILVIIGAIFIFIGIIGIFYRKYLIDNKILSLKNAKLGIKESIKESIKVKQSTFDILSNINIEHLNKYYKQIYDQCNKSFSIAKLASNISYGFLALALITFFISIFFNKDNKTNLVMVGITSGTGVIIKLVSSLYFFLYSKSIYKLSEYHDKLYTVQNILISLELSEQILDPGKKDDVKMEMIKMLIENSNKLKSNDKNSES